MLIIIYYYHKLLCFIKIDLILIVKKYFIKYIDFSNNIIIKFYFIYILLQVTKTNVYVN